MSRAAVLLDRDGSVSCEKGYINHVDRLRLYPDSAKAIRRLNSVGIPAVLITNQAGVARGYFPYELVAKVHRRLEELLWKEGGGHLDGIYFCPHHKDGVVKPYNVTCNCRKPATGLLDLAASELDLELSRSFMVGDKISDVELGKKACGGGILVKTGYGRGELELFGAQWKVTPDHIAENLLDAVDWAIQQVESAQ